jgi:hypothetical protein
MTAFNNVDDLYRSMIDQSSFLQDKNLEMETSILDTLFRDEKYDLVLYALEKGFTLSSERTDQIKVSGDLKLYQYLFSHEKLEIESELMQLAIKSGKMETIKWLQSKGCPWCQWPCAYAAEGGHFEVLKWLREIGHPWDEWTCTAAAKEGYLEILQWARENGCPWDSSTCSYAAKGGHFEVLKWARWNDCPWDQWTCIYAAKKGHLEILQWSRQNGCNWDKKHPSIAQFIQTHYK